MPSTLQSPARSSRNVTAVRERFTAGSVDVCKRGDTVSLHFGTTAGIFIFTLPLREFTLKCRGRVDHNLNSLPLPADLGDEGTGPLVVPERLRGNARSMPADQLARYQLALAGYSNGTFRSKRAAANFYQIGHLYSGFVTWMKRQAQAAPTVEQPPTDRPFVLKPGGKIL